MLAWVMLLAGQANCANSKYDPLALPNDAKPELLDLMVRGEQGGREIPIRVYLPTRQTPAPVVLFSHGLGGSRKGNAYLGQHWEGRGYVIVFTQHPGSDASVWQDEPPAERLAALKRAANPQNFLRRVKDIHLVLDQLERWNTKRSSSVFFGGGLSYSASYLPKVARFTSISTRKRDTILRQWSMKCSIKLHFSAK